MPGRSKGEETPGVGTGGKAVERSRPRQHGACTRQESPEFLRMGLGGRCQGESSRGRRGRGGASGADDWRRHRGGRVWVGGSPLRASGRGHLADKTLPASQRSEPSTRPVDSQALPPGAPTFRRVAIIAAYEGGRVSKWRGRACVPSTGQRGATRSERKATLDLLALVIGAREAQPRSRLGIARLPAHFSRTPGAGWMEGGAGRPASTDVRTGAEVGANELHLGSSGCAGTGFPLLE